MDLVETFSNTSNSTEFSQAVCTFPISPSPADVYNLFTDDSCYKHSSRLTILFITFNVLILVFGWFGNFLVIHVVSCRLKQRSASSLFIVNLAIADSLLLLFCIPPTLLVNIFSPWILGELMCKGVTYAQGVSVFVSVYSLVAISFDRCKAIHPNWRVSKSPTTQQPVRIIFLIWLFGLCVPLPWMFMFKLVDLNSATDKPPFPFCHEVWPTKTYELGYFFVSNMTISYFIPLVLIIIFNIITWKTVLQSKAPSLVTSRRKCTVLKVFTFLTFAFFLCWCPLYIIMTRVKVFYSKSFKGNEWEQMFMAVAVPIAQLLGPVNSCLNPVLYASLNKTYKECLLSLCCRGSTCKSRDNTKQTALKSLTRINCKGANIANTIKESYV